MGLDDASLDSLAVLGDELRRRMFDVLRRERRPLTREEVAAAVGVSRKLAAFHLDKLVAAGLLRAHYEPPDGVRRVGRQPKVYEPADEAISVSIPERRFELLAGILAEAVQTEESDETGRQAALRVAARRGHALGAAERERLRPGRLGAERGLTLAAQTLDGLGFEPERAAPGLLRLRNCPFHPLAAACPALVCAVNQAFLAGYLQGLGSDSTTAVLAPHPGLCCVELRAASPGAGTAGPSDSTARPSDADQ